MNLARLSDEDNTCLRRLSNGLLLSSDLREINSTLKIYNSLVNSLNDENLTILKENLKYLTTLLNCSLYANDSFLFKKDYSRLKNSILKSFKSLLSNDKCSRKAVLTPLSLFTCELLGLSEHREEQLLLLKSLISENYQNKITLSSLSALKPLLNDLTLHEFNEYVYPDLTRRLKRNSKTIILISHTIVNNVRGEFFIPNLDVFVELFRAYLSAENLNIPTIDRQLINTKGHLYQQSCYHVTCRTLQSLSYNIQLSEAIYNTISELLKKFESIKGNLSLQETVLKSILLLVPDEYSKYVPKLIKEHSRLLIVNTTSHPFESIHIKFIALTSLLIRLYASGNVDSPSEDAINPLINVILASLENLSKPLLRAKGSVRDTKLSERVLHTLLKGLKFLPYDDYLPIYKNLRHIITFTLDKPVYRNCCLEALSLIVRVPFDVRMKYEEEIKSENSKRTSLEEDLCAFFSTSGQKFVDLDSQLLLHSLIIKDNHFLENRKYKLSSLADLWAAQKVKDGDSDMESIFYTTTVLLLSHLTKSNNELVDSYSERLYTIDYLFDYFESVLSSSPNEYLFGLLLALKARDDRSIRFGYLYKLLVRLVLGRAGEADNLLQLLLIDLITSTNDDSLNGPYPEMINKFLNNCTFTPKRLQKYLFKNIELDREILTNFISMKVKAGYTATIINYHCLDKKDARELTASIFESIMVPLKSSLEGLLHYEREDVEIYLAREDVLYLDSRVYQPHLTQPLADKGKKKAPNYTKQQLDEMRYREQCEIRADIKSLVSVIQAGLLVIYRLLDCRSMEMAPYLRELLLLYKKCIGIRCLHIVSHNSLLMLLKCYIPSSISAICGDVANIFSIVTINKSFYTNEDINTLLERIFTTINANADNVTLEFSIIIMEIVNWTLTSYADSCLLLPKLPGDNSGEKVFNIKRMAVTVLIKQLEFKVQLDCKELFDIILATSKCRYLDDLVNESLRLSAEYLIEKDSLEDICHIGMSTRVSLVRDALYTYIKLNNMEDFTTISHYLMVYNIPCATLPNLHDVIALIPKYCTENHELPSMIVDNALAQYNIEDILSELLGIYVENESDSVKSSILSVLDCYLMFFANNNDCSAHASLIFKSLISFSTDVHLLNKVLSCARIIGNFDCNLDDLKAFKAMLNDLISTIDEDAPKVADNLKHVKLGSGLAMMGFSLVNFKGYDGIIQWTLRMLLKLVISPSAVFIGSEEHISNIIIKLTRRCVLEGQSEKSFIKKQIDDIFTKCLVNTRIILPFVSLLRGTGLISLKEHNVIQRLVECINNKDNEVQRNNALLILESISRLFGNLFESTLDEVFPVLVQNFIDGNPQVQSTAVSILELVTPVGFNIILPIILDGVLRDHWRVKSTSIRLLAVLIKNDKLHLLIVKNISKLIQSISHYTVDTNKEIRSSTDKVFDAIKSLVSKDNLLYAIINDVIATLTLPTDDNVLNILDKMKAIMEKRHADKNVTLVELGLLQPILSRSLKSRSGRAREDSVVICGWLASLSRDASELKNFFTSILPYLTPLLKDPLPDIRKKTANSIGICARIFKNLSKSSSQPLVLFDDLISTLLDSLTNSGTFIERGSAAYGLAEALQAFDDNTAWGTAEKLLAIITNEDNNFQSREGALSFFFYLPKTCKSVILDKLDVVFGTVIDVFDGCASDKLQEVSYSVCECIIENCWESNFELILNHLIRPLRSTHWQTRNATLPLLNHLNKKCGGNLRISTYLFIYRSDEHRIVQSTAMSFWKGLQVSEVLDEIFPTLIGVLIEMLHDEDHIKMLASKCISNVVDRKGDEAVSMFINRFVTDGDPDRRVGNCLGIRAIFEYGGGACEEYLDEVINYLRDSLCYKESCDDASKSLGVIAHSYPDVIVSMVIPNLLSSALEPKMYRREEEYHQRLFYIHGLESLVKSQNSYLPLVCNECLKEHDLVRLRLLERIMCINKGRLILEDVNYFEKVLNALLKYIIDYESETWNALGTFILNLHHDHVHILIFILLQKLLSTKGVDITQGRWLLKIITSVIQEKGENISHLVGEMTSVLSTFIFLDRNYTTEAIVLFEELLSVSERFNVTDSIIASLELFFTSTDIEELLTQTDGQDTISQHTAVDSDIPNGQECHAHKSSDNVSSSDQRAKEGAGYSKNGVRGGGAFSQDERGTGIVMDPSILMSLILLLQSSLLRGSLKHECIGCIKIIMRLVPRSVLGPHMLKLLGTSIRLLNDKVSASLKSDLLDLCVLLLDTDLQYVRAILSQLQYTYLKCLNDPNTQVNSLVSPNLSKLVQLVPSKCEGLITELIQVFYNKNEPPASVKTSSIQCIHSLLKLKIKLNTPPYSSLLKLLNDTSGNNKIIVGESFGFLASIHQDNWPKDWLDALFDLQLDNTLLFVLCEICKSEHGWNLLHQHKKFAPTVNNCCNSDIPSHKHASIILNLHISKHTKHNDTARTFLAEHIKLLPHTNSLPPELALGLLRIYTNYCKYTLSLDKFTRNINTIANNISELLHIKEANRVLHILESRAGLSELHKRSIISNNTYNVLAEHYNEIKYEHYTSSDGE